MKCASLQMATLAAACVHDVIRVTQVQQMPGSEHYCQSAELVLYVSMHGALPEASPFFAWCRPPDQLMAMLHRPWLSFWAAATEAPAYSRQKSYSPSNTGQSSPMLNCRAEGGLGLLRLHGQVLHASTDSTIYNCSRPHAAISVHITAHGSSAPGGCTCPDMVKQGSQQLQGARQLPGRQLFCYMQ